MRAKTLDYTVKLRMQETAWKGARRAASALGTTPSGIVRLALKDFLRRMGQCGESSGV